MQASPSELLPTPETTNSADEAPYEGDSEEDFPGRTIQADSSPTKTGDTDSEASDGEGDSEDDAPVTSPETKAARAKQKDEASESEPEISADLRRSDRKATERSLQSLQEDPANAGFKIGLKTPQDKKKRGKKLGLKGKPPKSARKKHRLK